MHLTIDSLSLLRSFNDSPARHSQGFRATRSTACLWSVVPTGLIPFSFQFSIFSFQLLIRVYINLYLYRFEFCIMFEIFYGLIDKLLDFCRVKVFMYFYQHLFDILILHS